MRSFSDFIIPECYVDTNLVMTLVCHNGCNHQKGCNQVTKVMKEKYANKFAVGMIDADKKKTTYINEFRELASKGHLMITKHNSRPHYIILVAPAIDKFILDCAADLNVNVSDFELSPILKEFTSQTKTLTSNKDKRFKRLFAAISTHPEIVRLKSTLKYLSSNQYRTADTDLKALFS